ncbi:uncharacterized protein LAESUDRAFT_759322 [Laetiporus sulphureus 93-53]|uniref:Uncharacterized protein n=1 Tax=Laetiporus sulphureus 93-53 TaxID=1314785 RepID=A0A165E8Y8_9APHY|nr:uncharacterized protein LAESUDRAFT_759322 [Laetiporus sulphureus 93-53]KZT06494.1 hypothetical protein LAESUDRAFT_759322 [Laetiporus sulphureus 93-53]
MLSLLLYGSVTSLSIKRQIINEYAGSIVAPANYTGIAPGAAFDFDYDSVNVCESGYEPITVWLLEQAPSVDAMASDGTFEDGTYLYRFGEWLIPNFGLPAQQDPPPPPDNLTMPDFSSAALGSYIFTNATFYLTIVETYENCPGYIPYEYGVTANVIVYNATTSF